ncbi:Muconate cycloisomerase 1 [bacterium HR17]|uniref:Muconate cycloisomerase 1 n=1 Tax=Candidatus Fervidibacter japonicus TaxID=2035412 RepID=A0A2H5XFQ4_9BACT|nr:Muconate cycloisomerase 1 [bacterium HR17]
MAKELRIVRVETFVAQHPVRGFFRFFPQDTTGRSVRPSVLVKITTDDGSVGWGETVPIPLWSYETVQSVVTTIEQHLAPAIVGMDGTDIAGIHRVMNQRIAASFSTGQPFAKAAIDLALHDLVSKALQVPLPRLWGRTAQPTITLSWTVNAPTLEQAEQIVAEGKARGFRHFNIKVAPDPKFDIALAKLVRQLAPEAFLWADANGGYDVATALQVAPKLAEVGVDVWEQPLPANMLSGYAELKRQGALPIVMDEGVVAVRDLLEFWRLGLLDGVAMKIPRMGGLLPARRCVETVLELGLLFLGSGLTDPPLSLAAHLVLYGSYGLAFPAALNGPQFLEPSPLYSPLHINGDQIQVPTGLGLGVTVNETVLHGQR